MGLEYLIEDLAKRRIRHILEDLLVVFVQGEKASVVIDDASIKIENIMNDVVRNIEQMHFNEHMITHEPKPKKQKIGTPQPLRGKIGTANR